MTLPKIERGYFSIAMPVFCNNALLFAAYVSAASLRILNVLSPQFQKTLNTIFKTDGLRFAQVGQHDLFWAVNSMRPLLSFSPFASSAHFSTGVIAGETWRNFCSTAFGLGWQNLRVLFGAANEGS